MTSELSGTKKGVMYGLVSAAIVILWYAFFKIFQLI
jgi:hypothetical protein